MTPEDVFTIIEMIDSMNRGRYAPAMIDQGKYRNVAVLWQQELEDVDAKIAAQAVAALFTATASYDNPRPVTVKDFNEAVSKIENDRRSKVAALPEAPFVRDMPLWAKGWTLARAQHDYRVWPQQKPGYDQIQTDNPHYRTYVWREQTVMPETDRSVYEEKASKMDAEAFDNIRSSVLSGSKWISQ